MSSEPIYVTKSVTINYLQLGFIGAFYFIIILFSTDVAEFVRKHWVNRVVAVMVFLELVNHNWNVYQSRRIELVFVWVSCWFSLMLSKRFIFF